MLSRLFSNHLKINQKSKIADYDGFHFENLQSAKYQTGSITSKYLSYI